MKLTIRLLVCCFAVIPFAWNVNSEEANLKKYFEKSKEAKRNGDQWISVNPGVFSAFRSCSLHRMQIGNAEYKSVAHTYAEPQQLEKIRNWLRANLTELLNTRCTDDSWTGPTMRSGYTLTLYADIEARENMMYVPLDLVFSNFSETDFQNLIADWGEGRKSEITSKMEIRKFSK